MNKRKLIWSSITMVLMTGIIVTQGNACSQFNATNIAGSTDNSSSGGGGGGGGPSTEIVPIPGAKTVSLVYSKQVLDQLTACAGVVAPSESTMSMYEQKKGAVSTYGYANTVTSPMMMAVTSIAGEVCNDLINQEATTKRIFKNIDFTSTALPSAADVNNVITRLALSCWQRPEEPNERQALNDMLSASVKAGDAVAGRKTALMVCTSMLSSLDALLN